MAKRKVVLEWIWTVFLVSWATFHLINVYNEYNRCVDIHGTDNCRIVWGE